MSTNVLAARVAYREAGRATICEILYGPNVLKHAVIDPEEGEGWQRLLAEPLQHIS